MLVFTPTPRRKSTLGGIVSESAWSAHQSVDRMAAAPRAAVLTQSRSIAFTILAKTAFYQRRPDGTFACRRLSLANQPRAP